MAEKTVRFSQRTVFSRVDKPTLVYESGSVHTLKADHADKWVGYGVATYEAAPVIEPEEISGNVVASSEVVAEPDSSAAGTGAVTEQPRRRGRPPRQNTDDSGR